MLNANLLLTTKKLFVEIKKRSLNDFDEDFIPLNINVTVAHTLMAQWLPLFVTKNFLGLKMPPYLDQR